MQTIRSTPSTPVRVLAGLAMLVSLGFASLGGLLAQGTPSGPAHDSALIDRTLIAPMHGARMEAPAIYEQGQERQTITVTYLQPVDLASLDDRDLWVVGHAGYSHLARLDRVKSEPFPERPALDADGAIREPNASRVVAIYSVPGASDGVWTEHDNGRYAVLLEPREVRRLDGQFLPAHLLGFFHVRVGGRPPQPEPPAAVRLHVEPKRDGGALAQVRIHFLDPYFVLADPGRPLRDGRHIVIEAAAHRVDFIRPPDEPAITERRYELADLEPGHYILVYKINGHVHARAEFTIPAPPQLPEIQAKAGIRVVKSPHEIVAHVRVEFFDYFMVDSPNDWGGPRRDGNRFVIDATASRYFSFAPVDFPFVQEHRYVLLPGVPPESEVSSANSAPVDPPHPERFEVVFQLNGVPYARAYFSMEPVHEGDLPESRPHPADADKPADGSEPGHRSGSLDRSLETSLVPRLIRHEDQHLLNVTYARPKAGSDTQDQIELSRDLVHWTPAAGSFHLLSIEDQGDGTERVTLRFRESISTTAHQFIRVRLAPPPE